MLQSYHSLHIIYQLYFSSFKNKLMILVANIYFVKLNLYTLLNKHLKKKEEIIIDKFEIIIF